MKAGRELDALVAEKVMGLPITDFTKTARQPYYSWGGKYNNIHYAPNNEPYVVTGVEKAGCPHVRRIDDYSTSISDAWQVVEKLVKEGDEHPVNLHKGLPAFGDHATPFEVYKNYAGYPGWTCYFHDYEVCVHADTAPLAICLAALKAVGVEVPND